MRVLLAFDKFKDALSASAACETAAAALRAKHPDWTLDLCPLTDGGEGFAETLTAAAGGRIVMREVSGPKDTRVNAPLGLVSADKLPVAVREKFALNPADELAILGLASASGIELVPPGQRDPWHTTTYGTGELMRHADREGAAALLLGIGGSATNDLGLGALAALGMKFDQVPVPATWSRIERLEGRVALPPLFIACDVTNPLLGPRGATATFGPQKGLQSTEVPRLEAEMGRMAALLCAATNRPPSLTETPGAGAAGGIGFGLMAAANARLVSGFDLVSDWLDLPARVKAADLVLTGEGRFDATSLGGKGPGSLVREAERLGKPVHVFAGSLGVPANEFRHAITPPAMPLAEALPRCAEFLCSAVGRVL